MKSSDKKIIVVIILLLALAIMAFYFYTTQINFAGTIECRTSKNPGRIEYTGPFNQRIQSTADGRPPSGLFKEIILVYSDTSARHAFIQVFGRDSTALEQVKVLDNIYILIPPDLTFLQKLYAVVLYYKIRLLFGFMCLLVLIFVIKNFRKTLHIVSGVFISLYRGFQNASFFILKEKKSLLIAIPVALIIYPIFLYSFNINFSILYNVPHLVIYPVICFAFFVPIFGILTIKRNTKLKYGFFTFWIILLLHYFIVSPFLYAGNFGAQGTFQNYFIVALENGFFKSLTFGDAGYISLLPRIVFGISRWLSPDMSQTVAITSFVALLLYSFIFSLLSGARFTFLWSSPLMRFIFVILVALFPVFSMVPGSKFLIMDTAYFGILFAFIILFIISELKPSSVLWLTLLNCVFILSKAHLLSLFPLYVIALIVFLKFKKNKGVFFTTISLFSMMIQLTYCYFNLKQIAALNQTGGYFSIQMFGWGEQIIVSVAYFLKSYIHLLAPFVDVTGKYVMFFICLIFVIICTLLFVALKGLKKSSSARISSWFIAGNILTFSSALFYAYTFPGDISVNRESFIDLIRSVDINLTRYTIGVHTILVFTVVPFMLFILLEMCKRFVPRFSKKIIATLFIIFITNGIIFNKAASVGFPNFWAMTSGDRWSYEWKQLVPLLRNKEYYIPVLSYPSYQQVMSTQNLEVSNDFVPKKQFGFSLKGIKNLHALIVLNASENKEEQIPVIAETFYKNKKNGQLNPLYKPTRNMRFIYFLNSLTAPVDSIVFLNILHEPALINTHIRVVSRKAQNSN